MRRIMIGLAAVSALWVQSAGAATVLSDNFDSSGVPGPNWVGDSVFLPVPTSPGPSGSGVPTVDLVGMVGGPDYFGTLAFSGNSIDLDGSSGNNNFPAGKIQSVVSFGPGAYQLLFELAGNLRGAPAQTTVVGFTGGPSTSFNPANNAPYTLEVVNFTLATAGFLYFEDLGPSDQQGNLLDDVTLNTSAANATPLPATWSMMLIGLLGFGFVARRQKQRGAALIAA
jgi:hypothetical protein